MFHRVCDFCRAAMLLRLLVAAPVLILLGGCSSSDSSKKDDAATLTIAVIPKCTGGEFWETVEKGARAAAEDIGVEIKWEGTLTETEIAEQNRIIENMTNLGVDGMAIAPLNKKATRKPIEGAVETGIPVVVFDSAVEGESHVAFVATDNTLGGRLGGETMIELLDGAGSDLVVMRFLQGTGSTEARCEGFISVVKEAGLNVIADPYPEDGTIAGAKKTASNTFEAFVKQGKLEVDGVFAANLIGALGTASALDDLRKGGIEVRARFIAFDTSPKLIDGLQEGSIDGLIAQNPRRMGYLAVESIVKHLRNEPIEAVVDTGVEVVTAKRLDEEPAIRKLVGLE